MMSFTLHRGGAAALFTNISFRAGNVKALIVSNDSGVNLDGWWTPWREPESSSSSSPSTTCIRSTPDEDDDEVEEEEGDTVGLVNGPAIPARISWQNSSVCSSSTHAFSPRASRTYALANSTGQLGTLRYPASARLHARTASVFVWRARRAPSGLMKNESGASSDWRANIAGYSFARTSSPRHIVLSGSAAVMRSALRAETTTFAAPSIPFSSIAAVASPTTSDPRTIGRADWNAWGSFPLVCSSENLLLAAGAGEDAGVAFPRATRSESFGGATGASDCNTEPLFPFP